MQSTPHVNESVRWYDRPFSSFAFLALLYPATCLLGGLYFGQHHDGPTIQSVHGVAFAIGMLFSVERGARAFVAAVRDVVSLSSLLAILWTGTACWTAFELGACIART